MKYRHYLVMANETLELRGRFVLDGDAIQYYPADATAPVSDEKFREICGEYFWDESSNKISIKGHAKQFFEKLDKIFSGAYAMVSNVKYKAEKRDGGIVFTGKEEDD